MENTQYKGQSAETKHRILGWMRRRVTKNAKQIWFRFDAKEFADFTGCSLRSVRYAMKRLKENPAYYGFEWRTSFNRSRGSRGSWEVLYAPSDRLAYDCEPLFRDREGKERHVRKHLRDSSISAPDMKQMSLFATSNEEAKMTLSNEKAVSENDHSESEVSATPITIRDTTYLSRVETPSRWVGGGDLSRSGERKLLRKASAIARRLEFEHWDSCKVRWQFYTARKYAFDALRQGFSEAKIVKCYATGLRHRHRDAMDMNKTFNPSSTIKKAREILSRDNTAESARVAEFYDDRRKIQKQIRKSLESAFSS